MTDKIPEAAIVRSRPAGIAAGSGLEAHLLRDIRAVGLPAPVREYHFAWCCEHAERFHITSQAMDYDGRPTGQPYEYCAVCVADDAAGALHPFDHSRAWRFDFAWPDRLLAVEVQGGIAAWRAPAPPHAGLRPPRAALQPGAPGELRALHGTGEVSGGGAD